jgi:GDP-L-fucose synthase
MLKLNIELENELINIGAGEEFAIRHFAKVICDMVGYDFNAIQFDLSQYVGAISKCLSTAKLNRLVPDLLMTPLEIGLEKTINWFLGEIGNLGNK